LSSPEEFFSDRHFGRVSLWTNQFENNNKLSNVNDVINAINNGQKNANKKRIVDGKNPIETYAIENKLVEPKELQKKLVFLGLQSTNAVTFHRETKKIINHIYPDTDTTHGLEITATTSKPYQRFDKKTGKQIPYILEPYAKLKEDKIITTVKIQNQENIRKKWQDDHQES